MVQKPQKQKASTIQILESVVRLTDKAEVHSVCKADCRAPEYAGNNKGDNLH